VARKQTGGTGYGDRINRRGIKKQDRKRKIWPVIFPDGKHPAEYSPQALEAGLAGLFLLWGIWYDL